MSNLCRQPSVRFVTDKVHAIEHGGCLPQVSELGKQICLPTGRVLDAMILLMEIGDRIRHARLSMGMTQRELADAIGISHGLVGAWESHKKAPGRDVLRRLAEATLTDPATLLTDIPENERGVRITNIKHIALLRRFARMSRRQQDNLLELLGIAADVRREMEQESQPAET